MASQSMSNLIDLMSESDLAKIDGIASEQDDKISSFMTREWLAICELGYYYGWPAIQAVNNDEITIQDMNMYIAGAKKVRDSITLDSAISNVAGNASSDENFKKVMDKYIKNVSEVN